MTEPVTAPRRYARLYHHVLDDPKFTKVWDDDHALSCWTRLLLLADMSWPAPATMYSGINRKAIDLLVSVGLVDLLTGSRYRIHGMDAERTPRSNAARTAAELRWGKNSNAPRNADSNAGRIANGNADAMPTRPDHTKPDQTSYVARETDHEEQRWRASKRQLAFLRNEITREELDLLTETDSLPPKAKA